MRFKRLKCPAQGCNILVVFEDIYGLWLWTQYRTADIVILKQADILMFEIFLNVVGYHPKQVLNNQLFVSSFVNLFYFIERVKL